jgi:hypothetical protein
MNTLKIGLVVVGIVVLLYVVTRPKGTSVLNSPDPGMGVKLANGLSYVATGPATETRRGRGHF